MIYDISDAPFEELVAFYFDHPDINYGSSGAWYYDSDVLYDSIKNANFFIELFREPRFLLDKFRRGQLDQGFWAISADWFDGSAVNLIFEDEDVPITLRDELIRAMYDLYEKLFAVDTIGQSSVFWWNHVAGYTHNWARNETTRHLADVIFETLLRLLDSKSRFCQFCAVDGLEKLRHMQTEPTLKRFLRTHPRLTKDLKAAIQNLIDNNPA